MTSPPTRPQPQVTPLVIYTDMGGKWGWACDRCASQSRYVYEDAATVRKLAARHLKVCSMRK